MSNTDIVIFGTGGFAREVRQLIKDHNHACMGEMQYNFLGYLDDDAKKHGNDIHGEKILGSTEWLNDKPNVEIVVAIGSPISKKKVVDRLINNTNAKFATLFHPNAIIGDRNKIGIGSIICAGTIITTDTVIGNHVIINLSCTLGHDAIIKQYSTIAPGVNISGNVSIEEGCDLGTNSVIIQGKIIGEWSIIGAGAVVVKNIPSYVTSVGNPSKTIKERHKEAANAVF